MSDQLNVGRVAYGPAPHRASAHKAYQEAIIACFCLGIVIGAVIELHRIAQALEDRALAAEGRVAVRERQLDGALEELHKVTGKDSGDEPEPKPATSRARQGSRAKPASKPAS